MTFKKNALEYAIRTQTDISKLTTLRDTGLDMILADPSISDTDFSADDKILFISIINSRIAELGA